MNFKEDATRYPLFFTRVGLETGHLDRLGLKVHPRMLKKLKGGQTVFLTNRIGLS